MLGQSMKKNGFTLIEILITVVLAVVVFSAVMVATRIGISSSLSTANRSDLIAKARNALTRVSQDIASSNINVMSIVSCAVPDAPDECLGNKILFKVPVVDGTPLADTGYTADGIPKYGAEGKQNCQYQYMVDPNNHLIRSVDCEPTLGYCGAVAGCQSEPEIGETLENCPQDCAECGDETCTSIVGENVNTCAIDCDPCMNCIHDKCETYPDCITCEIVDCYVVCGCEAGGFELPPPPR